MCFFTSKIRGALTIPFRNFVLQTALAIYELTQFMPYLKIIFLQAFLLQKLLYHIVRKAYHRSDQKVTLPNVLGI